jgi:hypothetical protein
LIERLTDDERRLAGETCARRAELELRGAAAFTAVTQALIELGAGAPVLTLAARAIAEELRHSEVYLGLARTYLGAEVAAPTPRPIDVPRHPGAPPRLERMLHVVGMCCVNETMACSFLELCLSGAEEPALRGALREVLADEVKHAQIGWAFLASPEVSAEDRREIARFIVPLLEMQWRSWRGQLDTLPPGALPSHGCPSAQAIERAAVGAIGDLVLAGFEHLGLDAAAGRAWLRELDAAR